MQIRGEERQRRCKELYSEAGNERRGEEKERKVIKRVPEPVIYAR